MMAKKKPIEEVPAPEPKGTLKFEGLEPPAERTAGKIVGEGARRPSPSWCACSARKRR